MSQVFSTNFLNRSLYPTRLVLTHVNQSKLYVKIDKGNIPFQTDVVFTVTITVNKTNGNIIDVNSQRYRKVRFYRIRILLLIIITWYMGALHGSSSRTQPSVRDLEINISTIIV